MKENKYYVYAYLDPNISGRFEYLDTCFLFKPFYIGKGSKNRLFQHLKDAKSKYYKKSERHHYINKLDTKPYIIKIKDSLTELQAFDLEEKYIETIGLDNLTNLVVSCIVHQPNGYKHSVETKRKIGEKSKGKISYNYKLISPDNIIYTGICLKTFCEDKKLNYDTIRKKINKGKIYLNSSGFKPKTETLNCENWEVVREDKEKIKPYYLYEIISPKKERFKIEKLAPFCKKHNLDHRTMMEHKNLGIIKIKHKTRTKENTLNCENWEVIKISDNNIYNNKKSKRKNNYIISYKNDDYYVSNIKKFCDEYQLNKNLFYHKLNENDETKINIHHKKSQLSINTNGCSIRLNQETL